MRIAMALLAVAAATGCALLRARLPPAPRPPACPRDSARDAAGRCACSPGTHLVLGACVSPEVAGAYCGPGARFVADGCAFAAHGSPRDRNERLFSGDLACPAGTRRGDRGCLRPPACPAGSLYFENRCRPVVFSGASGTIVDLGAWAAIVLGLDGGDGSPDLCRLLPAGAALDITLVVPDADITRAYASVIVSASGQGPRNNDLGGGQGPRNNDDAVLEPFLSPLRALGGQSSAASAFVRLGCRKVVQ